MDILLLGLAFDIFSALSLALSTLFSIFMTLASTSTNIIDISKIIGNIYVLLSVVMLFYMTISLLTYLVNPDKLTDKTSGGSKLVIKVVVTLALLIFTPTVFSISRDLQTAIMEENVLGKVILADNSTLNDESFKDVSHDISEVLVKAFLTPKKGTGESDPMYESLFFSGSTSMTELKTYAQDTLNYDFNWIMAIGCTVVLCLIVFGFLFDIAIRVIKLMFMELIAPIPIISNMIPKKNNMLTGWMKATVSAYVSLFIRIAVIYFFLYCISNIDVAISGAQGNKVIYAFIIIGALLFAKQLPKLIEDIFGIKLDGSFSLNPMARIREVPLLGSAVQTVGAGVGGLVTGASLGYKAGGIGTAIKMGGLGALSGGRAGWNQTKLGGVPIKDQKIEKNAYNAGASAVAQSITGNSDASSGFGDRFFNNIGTHLNEPLFEQKKELDRKTKAYEEAKDAVLVAQDAQREIASNHAVAQSRVNEITGRLNDIDSKISTFRTNYATNRATLITEETDRIDTRIAGIRNNRQTIIDDALRDTNANIQQAYDDYRDGKINGSERDARVNRYKSEQSTIRQTIENQLNQEITNLQIERTNVERTIDNKLANELNTLTTERTTVSTSLSEAQAVYASYDTQLNDANAEVATAIANRDTAKAERDAAKDRYKELQGPFKKNE